MDLPSAGLPADHGLASLGLVMQLAGRTTGALAALVASTALLDLRHLPHPEWFWSALALCFVRSRLHRNAGRDLTYSRCIADGLTADPLEAMRGYVRFGLAHAIAVGLVAALAFDTAAPAALGLGAALAVWPAVLAVVAWAPRFRRFRTGLPLGEDRGLEGTAIIMTVLGSAGALSAGTIVLILGALSPQQMEHGWGVMLVVVFALLVVRSSLHIRAGLAGLRDGSFDRPGELAARYASFGVISAFCIGGVLCLLAMAERLTPEAIAGIAVLCWLLITWPMVIKRYFNQRLFAELLAGDRMIHRRAPDAGLTGLGWLLLGHAALSAVLLIVDITLLGADARAPLVQAIRWFALDRWWSVGPSVDAVRLALELAAAAALIRMSDRRRALATIYAVFAGAAALAAALPWLRALGAYPDLWRLLELLPIAVQLVIPVAVWRLVHRAAAPLARARYRTLPSGLPLGPPP
ncbi:MAG: hypothetical protein E6J90_08650 [Deltaproteobacteria bacterium]|nr:MAG: hypothetical protein E6J91_47565 [Deltaproteobacteria bacterium]TMQ24201.1 MAG: hypothetical protein E6J90_08650 [Deltaproteobacteria bacterium]